MSETGGKMARILSIAKKKIPAKIAHVSQKIMVFGFGVNGEEILYVTPFKLRCFLFQENNTDVLDRVET